jgi:uncharacterized protein (DUF1330 family)
MNKLKVGLSILALSAIGATSISVLKAQTKAPVYAVLEFGEMTDPDAWIKAVSATEPKATLSMGGKFVVRTTKIVTLDGDQPPVRFTMIELESQEKLNEWRNSKQIKALNEVRLKATKSRSFMVEGATN